MGWMGYVKEAREALRISIDAVRNFSPLRSYTIEGDLLPQDKRSNIDVSEKIEADEVREPPDGPNFDEKQL